MRRACASFRKSVTGSLQVVMHLLFIWQMLLDSGRWKCIAIMIFLHVGRYL